MHVFFTLRSTVAPPGHGTHHVLPASTGAGFPIMTIRTTSTGQRVVVPDQLPPMRKSAVPFLHVGPGTPTEMIGLEHGITQLMTHYDTQQKRTRFCTNDTHSEPCWFDHGIHGGDWQGYLLVECVRPGRGVHVMHFTLGCVTLAPDLLDVEQSLHGSHIVVSRKGATSRQPMILCDLQRHRHNRAERPHFNMLDYLAEQYSRPNNDERRSRKGM